MQQIIDLKQHPILKNAYSKVKLHPLGSPVSAPSPNLRANQALHVAAHEGDLAQVVALLRQPPSAHVLSYVVSDGYLPIERAALAGHCRVMDRLFHVKAYQAAAAKDPNLYHNLFRILLTPATGNSLANTKRGRCLARLMQHPGLFQQLTFTGKDGPIAGAIWFGHSSILWRLIHAFEIYQNKNFVNYLKQNPVIKTWGTGQGLAKTQPVVDYLAQQAIADKQYQKVVDLLAYPEFIDNLTASPKLVKILFSIAVDNQLDDLLFKLSRVPKFVAAARKAPAELSHTSYQIPEDLPVRRPSAWPKQQLGTP